METINIVLFTIGVIILWMFSGAVFVTTIRKIANLKFTNSDAVFLAIIWPLVLLAIIIKLIQLSYLKLTRKTV